MLPGGIVNTRRRIIDLLTARGTLSRADLARCTRLSKPTISTIVAELLAEGILVEEGAGASTGGRKPIMLRLGGTKRLVAGIEIDTQSCRFLLVTLGGRQLAQAIEPTPATVDELIETIERGLTRLLAAWNGSRVIGCGVAVPGIIDPARDTVDFASRPGWRDLSLRHLLQERLKLPVVLTDRGKAAGLGELWHLGHEQRNDLIYLYLGRGVGGAIVPGNALHLGPSHTAGEIGHMVVDPDGPTCDCGRRGCLEAHISTGALIAAARWRCAAGESPALAAQLARASTDDAGIAAIGAAAAAGDPVALAIVEEAVRWLGLALANLINALNPARIVLGGPLTIWGALLTGALERELDEHALPVPRKVAKLAISWAGDLAVPLGAAALVLQRVGEFLVENRRLAEPWDDRDLKGATGNGARSPATISFNRRGA